MCLAVSMTFVCMTTLRASALALSNHLDSLLAATFEVFDFMERWQKK